MLNKQQKEQKKAAFQHSLKVIRERKTFDTEAAELTGFSPREALSEARTLSNYQEFIKEYEEEIAPLEESYPEDFEDFQAQAQELIELTDASLEYKIRSQSREQEFDTRPQFKRDHPGNYKETTKLFFQEKKPRTQKDEAYIRPEGVHYTPNTELYLCTEYGSFSFQATANNAAAALRVRRSIRNGVPFLSVGSIQINMNSGLVSCGLNGCIWARTLNQTHKDDRQLQEYVVLSILAHVGSHTHTNTKGQTLGVVPTFKAEPKRTRDSYNDKLRSHAMAIYWQELSHSPQLND